MGSAMHKCDVDGTPLGALDGPPFAEPGRVVVFKEAPHVYGRVRLWWRCCGAVLVEMMVYPWDPESTVTVTVRARLEELAPPPPNQPYIIPCLGAAWSLNLPCGHLAGEGCDCDTIAAEAAGQDQGPSRGRSQWEINETSLPG